MGRFSEKMIERDLDLSDISDGDEFDWMSDDSELTEEEVLKLEHQTLLAEIKDLEEQVTKLCDRSRYYGEAISLEQLERLRDDLRRIERNFR